ncbi:hypothetical protein [Sphingomonas sp. CARO-RG-8B-R24-01]|uniref:hypothetical protein n=1 Tax=Sphingomonas sp. CARO-RG-8B-R24-01 TaxID=2914831 RepID=UPI001F57A845|nr:hypothetical protein [Sphingomonas sp. CARO-RG-8B-R24-01]
MDPLFYVMAIMGCGDGSMACQQARIEPAQYRSIAQCQAAMPAALARNSDIDFPVVSASCRATGMPMASTKSRAQHG